MLWPAPPPIPAVSGGNPRSPCRPPLYGHLPKTEGQSCQKSLLFLCMTRMTPPPSAPSASRQAAISPLASPQLPCLMFFSPPPRLPLSWLPRLHPPQPLSSSSRVLIGSMLWPLLLSAAPRRQPSPRLLPTAQPITTMSEQSSARSRGCRTQEEEVKLLKSWRSVWKTKSELMTTLCPSGWLKGVMSQ